jgi:hypothetical protein
MASKIIERIAQVVLPNQLGPLTPTIRNNPLNTPKFGSYNTCHKRATATVGATTGTKKSPDNRRNHFFARARPLGNGLDKKTSVLSD